MTTRTILRRAAAVAALTLALLGGLAAGPASANTVGGSGTDVTVDGYVGEPYLRVGPDGASIADGGTSRATLGTDGVQRITVTADDSRRHRDHRQEHRNRDAHHVRGRPAAPRRTRHRNPAAGPESGIRAATPPPHGH